MSTDSRSNHSRYEDDNQRVYKSIPLKLPSGWRPDLNYSARSKDGRVIFDALPADANGNYCGVLLLKKQDELAVPDTEVSKLRELIDEYLPQFSALIDDDNMADIAKKPPSFLPSFRFAGPRLHQGDKCVVLGDAAHTVKPYFGLGKKSLYAIVLKRSRGNLLSQFYARIERSWQSLRAFLSTKIRISTSWLTISFLFLVENLS